MKKEKGQPEDTTGAGPGKDSYQVKGSGQNHQNTKPRQDGKNHTDHVEAHTEAGWKLEHSQTQGPING